MFRQFSFMLLEFAGIKLINSSVNVFYFAVYFFSKTTKSLWIRDVKPPMICCMGNSVYNASLFINQIVFTEC